MQKQIISHCKRLNTFFSIDCTLAPQDEEVFVKEQVEFDGRLITRTTTQTVNIGSNLSKFKASDFSLENLIAIGATDHFKPMGPLRSNDIDTSLLSLDSLMDIIDSMDEKRQSSFSNTSEPSTPETISSNA